jgi:hypothetical protein
MGAFLLSHALPPRRLGTVTRIALRATALCLQAVFIAQTSIITLQRRGMALIRYIGFHHVADHHLIQLGALIDMDPMLFPIVILDGVVLSLDTHQSAFDGVFSQPLFDGGAGFFLTHRIRCIGYTRSET